MSSMLRQRATVLVKALGDGWMSIGITLLILVAAESCYRIQGTVRQSFAARRTHSGPSNPLDTTGWYRDYVREYESTFHMRWKPYVYFRRLPFRGRFITIDSFGHRVVPQPAAATPERRVFFMGGSTMWGSYQRDSATIPAEAARRMLALPGPESGIEVTNLGESGYVFTQEMLELMLQLRAGNRPNVVVFYDGINDVAATLQSGAAGIPQNESNRVAEFAMGREVSGFDSGLAKDLRTLFVLGKAGFQKSELVQRLQATVRPSVAPMISADSAVRDIVRVYTGNVRIIEALAATYGFEPVYVWQPALYSSQKHLTPFEQGFMTAIRNDPFQRRLQEVHLAVPRLLDSAMATIAPRRFVDASTLFAGDSQPVFADQLGHLTETAVPRIVDAIWPYLGSALVKPAATPVPGRPR